MVKILEEQRHADILDLAAVVSSLHYTKLPLSDGCDGGTCVHPLCQHKKQLHPVNVFQGSVNMYEYSNENM
jgi:hypothetical protein